MKRKQEETGNEKRHKLVHTLGVVGSIEFNVTGYTDYTLENGGKYTGLYETGANWGVIRLSETGFLLDDVDHTQIFSPSIGIKFFLKLHSN